MPPRFGGYVPARHPALRYGLTLNDRGYFGIKEIRSGMGGGAQGGRERILLRACILIATANLRLRMQAARHGAIRKRSANSRRWGRGRRRRVCRSGSLLIKAKSRPRLAKADWVAFAAIGGT